MPELTEVREAVSSLRRELLARGEAAEVFGQERGHGLASILGAVRQSFAGQDVYPGIEEKAAHLLYFVTRSRTATNGSARSFFFCFGRAISTDRFPVTRP